MTRRPLRLLAAPIAALIVVGTLLTGCSDPAPYSAPEPQALGTPALHPCDVVPDAEAADLLGSPKVTGERIDTGDLPGGDSIATCQYGPTRQGRPGLTLQSSATDEFDRVVSLFATADAEVRPVDVPGTDDAVLVIDRTDTGDASLDIYTVVALGRGEVHFAIVDAPTGREAVRVATRAAALLVAG